MWKSREM